MFEVKMQPISVIEARLGIEPNGKVQKFFTNTCRIHMDKYVPMDTGALRENVSVTSDSITYESPYAHYQYMGISKNGKELNYKTPLTGSSWDERMKTAELNDVIQETQDYFDRGGK